MVSNDIRTDTVWKAFESLRFAMNLDESTVSQGGMRMLAGVAVRVLDDLDTGRVSPPKPS